MAPGWLRGPFTAERRGLPMAGEFSWDGNGISDRVHAGGTLSGEGVRVRELPRDTGRVVNSSGRARLSLKGGLLPAITDGVRLFFLQGLSSSYIWSCGSSTSGPREPSRGGFPCRLPYLLRLEEDRGDGGVGGNEGKGFGGLLIAASRRSSSSILSKSSGSSSTVGENVDDPNVMGGWIEIRTQF